MTDPDAAPDTSLTVGLDDLDRMAAKAWDPEGLSWVGERAALPIAAACHLAPMVEYADLDGSLLLDSDPFTGVPMPGGRIDFGSVDVPGTGAHRG